MVGYRLVGTAKWELERRSPRLEMHRLCHDRICNGTSKVCYLQCQLIVQIRASEVIHLSFRDWTAASLLPGMHLPRLVTSIFECLGDFFSFFQLGLKPLYLSLRAIPASVTLLYRGLDIFSSPKFWTSPISEQWFTLNIRNYQDIPHSREILVNARSSRSSRDTFSYGKHHDPQITGPPCFEAADEQSPCSSDYPGHGCARICSER